MAYKRKWKPSKTKIKEFKDQMEQINEFIQEKGIIASKTNDSYYFNLNGINYRVSNHTIEASNKKAFNEFGQQIREEYHKDGRQENTIYITASKTRIIEIYTNLEKGYELDKRGKIINK